MGLFLLLLVLCVILGGFGLLVKGLVWLFVAACVLAVLDLVFYGYNRRRY